MKVYYLFTIYIMESAHHMTVNQCPFTGILYTANHSAITFIREQNEVTYLCTGSKAVYKGPKGGVYSVPIGNTGTVREKLSLKERDKEALGRNNKHAYFYDKSMPINVKPLSDVIPQNGIASLAKHYFEQLMWTLVLDEADAHNPVTPKYYEFVIDALEDKSLFPHRNIEKHTRIDDNSLIIEKTSKGLVMTKPTAKGEIITRFDNTWDLYFNHKLGHDAYSLKSHPKDWVKAWTFFMAVDATR